MLRIYRVVLEMIAMLVRVAEEIEKHDASLGKQMRRALASVGLNTAEGMGNTGGHKRERYQDALGSSQEVQGCIDVATAMRYIGPVDPIALDKLQHVIATLTKLVHRRS